MITATQVINQLSENKVTYSTKDFTNTDIIDYDYFLDQLKDNTKDPEHLAYIEDVKTPFITYLEVGNNSDFNVIQVDPKKPLDKIILSKYTGKTIMSLATDAAPFFSKGEIKTKAGSIDAIFVAYRDYSESANKLGDLTYLFFVNPGEGKKLIELINSDS